MKQRLSGLTKNIRSLLVPENGSPVVRKVAGGLFFFLMTGFVVVLIHKQLYSVLLKNPHYQVRMDRAEKMDLPRWAQEDVKRSLLHHQPGDTMSSMSRNLPEQVRRSYRKNPWIRSVRSVRRNGRSSVSVRVLLRKPVAAISGPDRSLYLIDKTGTRLPGTYSQIPPAFGTVFRTSGFSGAPPAPGEKWKAPQVRALASVAKNLLNTGLPNRLVIRNIRVRGNRTDWRTGRGEVVIMAEDNVPVEWGRATWQGGPGQPRPEQKLKNLRRVLRGAPGLAGLKRVKLQYRHPIISFR